MKRLIEKIKQKPDHHKMRIIWSITLTVLVILLVVWLMIGIPTYTSNGDAIDNINSTFKANQNVLPELFPK